MKQVRLVNTGMPMEPYQRPCHLTRRLEAAGAGAKMARLYDRLIARPVQTWQYPGRLAVEERLRLPDGPVAAVPISARLREQGWISSGPFNSLAFWLYRRTGQRIWLEAFVREALAPLETSRLSEEGAWLHPRGLFGAGYAVLIDSFQEEASRLAKLAWLIRRGDLQDGDHSGGGVSAPIRIPEAALLEALAAEQFFIHRRILEDAAARLWHNGRGWEEGRSENLSPGFWSRGHGWLLRGLLETIVFLSPGPSRERLIDLFRAVVEAVFRWRSDDLLWPALLTAQPGESPPESSGSAMMVTAVSRAVRLGILDPETWSARIEPTIVKLFEQYLDVEGIPRGACPGPGPLVILDDYGRRCSFPDGEPHGVAAFSGLWAACRE